MGKIKCGALNCSHNKSEVCYANMITVVGKNSEKECDTSCSSFLDSATYGSLTNNIYAGNGNPCDAIGCQVNTCIYNTKELCSLDTIKVAGDNAMLYNQTTCQSFDKR
jgi:Domain of Unknown Function (DUF1540)